MSPGDRSLRLLSHLAPTVDPADLRGHFVLGSPPPYIPDGWTTHRLGHWTLAVDPHLPVLVAGDSLGWLVGAAFDLEQARAVEAVSLEEPTNLAPWFERHTGRFALLLPGAGIVSADAVATLPIVFDPERGVVASSPFLLQPPDEPIPDDELTELFCIDESSLWFVFDATPHARARRLLPNHVLDLTSWEQVRVWPTGPFARSTREVEAERMASTVERTMAAVASTAKLNLSLTAGGDSRVVLACSRAVIDRARFFTVPQPDYVGRVDTWLAPRMAKRFGLDYRLLPWRDANRDDVRRFRIRTGALVGEPRGSQAGPTYAQLGDGRVYAPGVWSRVEYGWREGDTPATRLDGADLLARYRLPPQPRLVAAAERWLSDLPGLDAIDALTLLGIELRDGLWAGPLTTAYPDAYSSTIYPFAHRSLLQMQLSFSYQDRRGLPVREDVIRSRWPELLEYPINRGPLRFRVARRLRRG